MKEVIKWLLPVPALHYMAYAQLIANRDSFLYTMGWMKSVWADKPLDAQGNLMPWMNTAITNLLEERLTPDLTLFEFGSGYSTLYYALRVKSVTSVEYDRAWFNLLKPQIPHNVTLIFQEKDVDGSYCRVIGSTREQYDVIVVDGRDRVNCVKQSLSALTPRGVLLLDDSHRDAYREGVEFAKAHGFKALGLESAKVLEPKLCKTTIFYREGNCLDL